MTFLGKERMDHHTQEHLHESPWVVTVPLILLAIPSALIGWFTVKPMLFGKFFEGAIHVAPATTCSSTSVGNSTAPEHLSERIDDAAGVARGLGRAHRIYILFMETYVGRCGASEAQMAVHDIGR